MKKLMTLFAFMFFGFFAFSQSSTTANTNDQSESVSSFSIGIKFKSIEELKTFYDSLTAGNSFVYNLNITPNFEFKYTLKDTATYQQMQLNGLEVSIKDPEDTTYLVKEIKESIEGLMELYDTKG